MNIFIPLRRMKEWTQKCMDLSGAHRILRSMIHSKPMDPYQRDLHLPQCSPITALSGRPVASWCRGIGAGAIINLRTMG